MAESSYHSGSATEARTNRESIKINFDKVKRFASTNFTRARQVREAIAEAGVSHNHAPFTVCTYVPPYSM